MTTKKVTKAKLQKRTKARVPRKAKVVAAAVVAATKTATVIGLLERSGGATLAELMAATGWQAHSVRGFLSGTLKKKLGHTITRDGSTYTITKGK